MALGLRCFIVIAASCSPLRCRRRLIPGRCRAALRVAIVGLAHGHVEGFLAALPKHSDVQLVGIAEADTCPRQISEEVFARRDALLQEEANMIENTQPQAMLVYTSIAEHRQAIEIAAQYGVSVMVEKPLTISLEDALAIRRTPASTTSTCWSTTKPPGTQATAPPTTRCSDGRIGEIRRVVIHDGHQGPKEIGVPPEFLKLAHRPRAERRRRSLRLRLLRRRPDDLDDARRNAAHRHRRRQSRQAARSIRSRRRLRPSCCTIRMRRPSFRPRGTGPSAARIWKSTEPPATRSPWPTTGCACATPHETEERPSPLPRSPEPERTPSATSPPCFAARSAQRRSHRARHQHRRDADSRCRPHIGANRTVRAPPPGRIIAISRP